MMGGIRKRRWFEGQMAHRTWEAARIQGKEPDWALERDQHVTAVMRFAEPLSDASSKRSGQ